MPDYTTTGLISQIRRRSSMPDSQNLFTDDKLIDMINDEFVAKILPFVVSFHEEYYLSTVSYTTDGSTTEYDIPSDAIGSKMKDVQLWDSNGNMLGPLTRLSPSELSWGVSGYYIENNKIVMYPDAINTGSILKILYYKRPNSIIPVSESAKVTSVTSTTTTTVVCQSIPANIVNGSTIDIVQATPPFKIKATKTITAINVNDFTIPLTTGISAGDYVCLTGDSVVAEIPAECYVLLAQAVVLRCLEALGDSGGLQIAASIYEGMKADVQNLLTPRVENEPKRIYLPYSLRRYV